MTTQSGHTRRKEACKFVKPEKSGIWFVIPLTVLYQGELSYFREVMPDLFRSQLWDLLWFDLIEFHH